MQAATAVVRTAKAQLLFQREQAILDVVNRLLAAQGFDAMTVDAVAEQAGMAKASLYKHFPCKEDLAAAAMVRVLARVREVLEALPAAAPPLQRLRAVLRWAMERQLAGEIPPLPGPNSRLRARLVRNRDYLAGRREVGDQLGAWIAAAQAQGAINPRLPARAVLYTLYARACDPVLGFLQADGNYSDAQIVDLALATCFEGLVVR